MQLNFDGVRKQLRNQVLGGSLDFGKYVKLTGVLHRIERINTHPIARAQMAADLLLIEYQEIANGTRP